MEWLKYLAIEKKGKKPKIGVGCVNLMIMTMLIVLIE